MAWMGMRRLFASLITFSTSVPLPLSRPSEMTTIAFGAGKSVCAPPLPGDAASGEELDRLRQAVVEQERARR